MPNNLRMVFATTREGLVVAAGNQWRVIESSIRAFRTLETSDDHSLGDIGMVIANEPGYVAFCKEIGS